MSKFVKLTGVSGSTHWIRADQVAYVSEAADESENPIAKILEGLAQHSMRPADLSGKKKAEEYTGPQCVIVMHSMPRDCTWLSVRGLVDDVALLFQTVVTS